MNTMSKKETQSVGGIKVVGVVDRDFSKIPIAIWRDEELGLSLNARAILTKLLTLPPKWKLCWAQISKQLQISESTLRKVIKELSDLGLLKVFRLKNEVGEFEKGVYAEIKLDYFLAQKDEDKNTQNLSENEAKEVESKKQDDEEQNAQKSHLYPNGKKSTCGDFTDYIDYKILNKDVNISLCARKNQKITPADSIPPKHKQLLREKQLVYALNSVFTSLPDCIKSQRATLKKPAPSNLSEAESQAFNDFIAYRVEKNRGKKLTNATHNGIVKEFERLKNAGVDIRQAVHKAIHCGWAMIYEPSKPKYSNCAPQNFKLKETAFDRLQRLKSQGIFS